MGDCHGGSTVPMQVRCMSRYEQLVALGRKVKKCTEEMPAEDCVLSF